MVRRGVILVVEGDPTVRDRLRGHVGRLGYRSLGAGTPAVAVDLAAACHFDLVIADVDPRDAETAELVSDLRSRQPELSVILLGPPVDGHAALPHGTTLLTKPVALIDLDDAIERSCHPSAR